MGLANSMICKYCHDKDNGWVRVPDGHGCVEWTHCVCMPTDPVKHEANGGKHEEQLTKINETTL